MSHDSPNITPDGVAIGSAVDRRRRARPVDRPLNLLLLAAERDVQVGLTVSVNGTVVSGTLIGMLAYFRALADQLSSSNGYTEMDERFADSFRTVIDDAQQTVDAEQREREPAEAEDVVEFLHLANARYVSGSGFLPHGRVGVLWRCRVADVDGWSLGDLIAS